MQKNKASSAQGSHTNILCAEHISKSFYDKSSRKRFFALKDISVDLHAGERLALIGGSGSGKTTLARILLALDAPDTGSVSYFGDPLFQKSSGQTLLRLRRESGLVFQNPFSSLDQRWQVFRSVAEPLAIRGLSPQEIQTKVFDALCVVGLDPTVYTNRFPCDLSGGQAQRVALARAIVAAPRVLIADEPMSALDVVARIQILDAFKALQKAKPDMAQVMISHDLGIVRSLADYIVVLHEGSIVEEGPTETLLRSPQHPYTQELIAAAEM